MLDKKSLTDYARRERASFESTLKEFVEIPSVSADPARSGDVRKCAQLACDTIRKFGGEAEMFETAGHPIVHGRFTSGKRRSHGHDLQPSRRTAGVARDRAVEDRSVQVHEGRRPLLRPWHDRRQRSGAFRVVGNARGARGRRAGERERAVGARGRDRIAELRGGDQEEREEAEDRSRDRVRHDLGLANASGMSGRTARTAGIHAVARSRRDRSAFRRHRRRRAQPDRRADEARVADVRRADRAR